MTKKRRPDGSNVPDQISSLKRQKHKPNGNVAFFVANDGSPSPLTTHQQPKKTAGSSKLPKVKRMVASDFFESDLTVPPTKPDQETTNVPSKSSTQPTVGPRLVPAAQRQIVPKQPTMVSDDQSPSGYLATSDSSDNTNRLQLEKKPIHGPIKTAVDKFLADPTVSRFDVGNLLYVIANFLANSGNRVDYSTKPRPTTITVDDMIKLDPSLLNTTFEFFLDAMQLNNWKSGGKLIYLLGKEKIRGIYIDSSDKEFYQMALTCAKECPHGDDIKNTNRHIVDGFIKRLEDILSNYQPAVTIRLLDQIGALFTVDEYRNTNAAEIFKQAADNLSKVTENLKLLNAQARPGLAMRK